MNELKLTWMYYDLLELYGDRGNIKVFEFLCQQNNINLIVDKVSIHQENIDISNSDIVFLGGGSDKAMELIENDIRDRKDQMEEVLKRGGFILGICGGYQMMGKTYLNAKGESIKGLGLFDFYTIYSKDRCVGNIKTIINIPGFLNDYEVVGFENHSGVVQDAENNYFGKVKEGNGNLYKGKYEGYYRPGFLGTFIHGPLLPKNPKIATAIIEYVLKNKYQNNQKINIKDQYYIDTIQKAKEDVIF